MKLFNQRISSIRSMSTRHGLAQFLFGCGALMLATDVRAGDLMPPAGPVMATMKTLLEVEPRKALNATNAPGDADSLYKIAAPGSYYLTGNITGVAGKHGIEIAANKVTLDLMGFELLGIPGSLDGISQNVALMDVVVINGSVRNWGAVGVKLDASLNLLLDGIRAINNSSGGILASHAIITQCAAFQNGGSGIFAHFSVIDGCLAKQNTEFGFRCSQNCTISNSSALFNSDGGFESYSGGNMIIDCLAFANVGNGITVTSGSTVRGCTSNLNGAASGNGAGIYATFDDNRIEGNNCIGNDRGVDVDGSGNFITRNTCSGNATNWEIATGNVILVINATTAGAFSGNSGGVAPGSTDPNANFTY